jgi:hypothetical protein
MMRNLEIVRDALAGIAGVASCKIGLEANISPADYPLIRIVPARIIPGKPYRNRTAECFVFLGAPVTNSEGLESVYAALFELEHSVLLQLQSLGCRYIETDTDEDRIDTYKVFRLRVEVPSDARTEGAPSDLPISYEVGA